MMASEQSPQDPLSQSVSMQDQDQTSSREYCEAKSNNGHGSEKGLRESNVSLALEFWWISRASGGSQPSTGFGFKSKQDFSGNFLFQGSRAVEVFTDMALTQVRHETG
jgi:hypothetical protein